MTVSPAYRKAPITEAVIDLRVRTPAKPADLDRLVKKLAGHYPDATQMSGIEVRIGDVPGKVPGNIDVKQSTNGYRMASKDQADVCIAVAGGITTSRLAPYIGWDELAANAQRNWDAWSKITGSTQAARIGVRYINRIDVPKNENEGIIVLDYVRLRPEFPKISDNSLTGFGLQISAPLDAPNWFVNLSTGTIIPPPLLNHVSFLLDIDVYREVDLPSNSKKLWAAVDEAHHIKNNLFETMITDSSRKLFS